MRRKIGLGFISKLYAAVTMFFVSVFFARILGPEQFGYFSFLLTLVPFLSYLIVFGQDQSIFSRCSSKSHHYLNFGIYTRISNSLFFNSLVFSLLIIIVFIYFLVSYDGKHSEEFFLSCVSVIAAFIFAVRRVLLVFFRVNRKEILAILPESIIYPSLLLLVALCVYVSGAEFDFYYAAIALLIAAVFSLIPFYNVLFNSFSKFRLKRTNFSVWYNQGVVFCCLAIAEGSIFFVDRLMVFHFLGPEFLSYYQIAIRFVEILLIFESAYLLVSMQKIATLRVNCNTKDVNEICKTQTRFIFMFNLLGAGFLFIISDFLVVIYGSDFSESIPLLKAFCVFLILNSILGSSNYICTVVGLEKQALYATIASVLAFFGVVIFFGNEMSLQMFVFLKCIIDFFRKLYCTLILKKNGINIILR